jgi:hypothetical protein
VHQVKFVKTTSGHGNASLFYNGFISLATLLTHWHLGRHSETLQNMCKCNVNLMVAKVGLGLGQLTQHPNNQEPTIAIENFAKDQQLRSSSPETPCLPAEHSRLQWHSTQSPDTKNIEHSWL